MRISIIILLIFIQKIQAQNLDYCSYHQLINEAEYSYFIEQNVDSCLNYYDVAFRNFDFVFVKDLVIASQIAYFEGKNYRKYIIQAFKFGLKLNHLKDIQLFNLIIDSLLCDKELQNEYEQYRKEYLSTINFPYLLYIYDLYMDDQLHKRYDDIEYEKYLIDKIVNLKQQILKNGFPGNKTIGIDCDNIFTEIGKPKLDLNFQKKKLSKIYSYICTNDGLLAQTITIPFLYHNPCSFCELEDMLIELLKKGEIHPRYIGLIYDNMYSSGKKRLIECKKPNINNGLFMLDPYCKYGLLNFDRKKTNEIRKKWYVAPIEVDEAMKEYENKYGFNFFLRIL